MDRSVLRPALQKYGEHAGHVYALGWNCDGSLVASGGNDAAVKIFSFVDAAAPASDAAAAPPSLSFGSTAGMHRLSLVGSVVEHPKTVEALAWDPKDPHRLCSVSAELVHVVDVTKLKKNRSSAVTHKVTAALFVVAFAGDGRHLAVSGKEEDEMDSVTVLSVEPRRLQPTTKKPRSFPMPVQDMVWAPDAAHVLVGSTGLVEILAAATLETVHSFRAHNSSVSSLSLSPDGSALAVGSMDSLLGVWSVEDLACYGCLSGEPTGVRTTSWDAAGRWIAWGCDSNRLFVGEAGASRAFFTATTEATVNTVAFHPRLPVLAVGCNRSVPTSMAHSGGHSGWVHLYTFR